MVILGVILVLLALAAGVLLFAGTAQLTDTVDIDLLGGTLRLPPLTLLITGMIVISVFWLGWALLRGGLRRAKRRQVEAKEAAAAAEARRIEEERRLKEEFAAREAQLLDERRRREGEAVAPATDGGQRVAHDRLDHGRHAAEPTPHTTRDAPLDDTSHRRDGTAYRSDDTAGRDPDGRPA